MSRSPFAISPRIRNPTMIRCAPSASAFSMRSRHCLCRCYASLGRRGSPRLAAGLGPGLPGQIGDALPAVPVARVGFGARRMESGHHGMEYQKKGGNGGINDQGRLDTVLLNAKTTQPHPLSVPFDFHGRYDSYIHLKSDRLLG